MTVAGAVAEVVDPVEVFEAAAAAAVVADAVAVQLVD